MHILSINERILIPQDGLVIGNGDLSVSVYQGQSEIVWRFGKGDVWDRRHPIEDDPHPLTMDELRNGIEKDGWVCPAFGGKVEALRGTKDPKRMLEVLSNSPSQSYPYPTPKPVGELSLRWPGDLLQLEITQNLVIEEGRIEIFCKWPDGEKLQIDCFVHPTLNVLVVRWKFEGWHPGSAQPFFTDPPILLSLYRWADPSINEFAAKYAAKYNYYGFDVYKNKKATPLAKPKVISHNGFSIIEQNFYPDPLFPDGFKYWLGCVTNQPSIEHANTASLGEARLTISSVPSTSLEEMSDYLKFDKFLREGLVDYPEQQIYDGWVVVPVTTSSDVGGVKEAFDSITNTLKADPDSVINVWDKENKTAAQQFWERSAIHISESSLENLWYQSLHIARSVLRNGTVPPGLYLPSTIQDYSLWHGDYHTNYNIQQPFWGFHMANHSELAEPYFTIMNFLDRIGQKIAHDYCGTRGTFIQISGFPIECKDDPIPTSPMSRMPYMTGWAPEIFWWHYLYSRDVTFLRDRGYPFIRDCALFYTDFLQLGEDGKYHAIPSCWGEEGYDGNIETSTDALQTMEYAYSCLKMAINASEELDIDSDLRKCWLERIEKLDEGRGESEWRPIPEIDEQHHKKHNVPAFRPGENYRFPYKWPLAKRWWGWIDKLTNALIRDIRGGQFIPERDFADLVKIIERWRHPNGLIWPMPVRFYGEAGGCTEALGVITPLQEMMLQSWDGIIRIFPRWHVGTTASFKQLRAEGAFLVSAVHDGNVITDVQIKSLLGGGCKVANPWQGSTVCVMDVSNDQKVCKDSISDVLIFDSKSEHEYRISRID